MKKYNVVLVFLLGFMLYCSTVGTVNGVTSTNFDDQQSVQMTPQDEKVEVIVFVREGCNVCKKQEEFLRDPTIQQKFDVQLRDIGDSTYKLQWEQLVQEHQLSKVTPITLVGGNVFVGFTEKTTGTKIMQEMNNTTQYGLNYYLGNVGGDIGTADESYCVVDSSSACSLDLTENDTNADQGGLMTLPFFGEVNVKETSLFVMAAALGFIDGFNPCAMWVLLTFLIILSQIGDKKKMIYLASLFIFAEAVMYFLILNVWYQTWDFIKLDQIVTPLVGLLAIGGGIYFLYKWYKNKGELTCEVTSFEHQQKTTQKIRDAVSKPITIITIFSILTIAFSVNIIEFACSVGIAQSFTKILEINDLGIFMRQFYISLYTIFYMMDDFLIFGLAIAGYQKFHVVGAKYSHISNLIGGILMLFLGILLVFFSDILVF